MGFYQLLVVSVILNVTANVLLKKGVLSIGGVSGDKARLFLELTKAAVSPYIVIGLALYGLSFLIWLRVLSFNDLSKSYPIFASIVFLMTTLGSIKFLNEDVSLMRFVGMAIMLVGIFIVAKS
ncbi:MAG: SMR family transporter [Candidatus Curtissbacteria bacterium]|nr:SMR family transporter [Candidatus Curtissbacteria bacterium]